MLYSDFIKFLRQYHRDSIIKVGTWCLWDVFRNNSLGIDAQQRHLMNAFGDKIIILALATCNNYRTKRIQNPQEFLGLCNKFVSIKSSIEDKDFLDKEADEIFENLLSEKTIPEKYLDRNLLRQCSPSLWLQRTGALQSLYRGGRIEELFTDYIILKQIGIDNSHEITKILSNMDLSLLKLFRVAFCLFSVCFDNKTPGRFSLKNPYIESSILGQFNVNINDFKLVANFISCKENDLINWYRTKIPNQHPYFQMYVSTPLVRKPLVNLDRPQDPYLFLIPSPLHFIRGFRECLFTYICSELWFKQKSNILGDAIELHIFMCLKEIFGQSLEKIDHSGQRADFFVRLEHLDLIIEVKTNIGGIDARTISNAKQIPSIWKRFHDACTQCSNSIKQLKKTNRKTIAIIIVANHFSTEHLNFQDYVTKSGLLNELDIKSLSSFHGIILKIF